MKRQFDLMYAVLALLCWNVPCFADEAARSRARHPGEAIFLDGGKILCVANQQTGTLSLIDMADGNSVAEHSISKSVAGMARLQQSNDFLLLDTDHNQLTQLRWLGGRICELQRLNVSTGAATVAVAENGQIVTVAGLWSHRIDVIRLRAGSPIQNSPANSGENEQLPKMVVERTVELPFPPRFQALSGDGRTVIVADAFGGQIAVIEPAEGRIVALCELNGHNIRGLALDSLGHLIVAHQILNQKLPTTQERIERGELMRNVISVIPLNDLLNGHNPQNEIMLHSPQPFAIEPAMTIELGAVGRGAGDPSGVVVCAPNLWAVALAGVNEVELIRDPLTASRQFHRIAVGRRPLHLVQQPGSHTLVAINNLDDSISVLDTVSSVMERTIKLGPDRPTVAQERGERLFFDAKLSRDGWMSCHSCHPDGHSNGLLADTQGDNTVGAPKRSLTLLGTAFTYRWAWNGEVVSLHDQVQKSQRETMHGPRIGGEEIRDLVAFLHTLPPPPAVAPDAIEAEDRARLQRGRRVFESRQCQTCHIPPIIYASHESFDVGLRDERGLTKFNPPSLRGVSQGRHYFHDNRAQYLEQVFSKYQHPRDTILSEAELADLLRFLRSL